MIIQYDKKAKKFIEAQDRITKQRLKAGIEGLTFNPPKGDIKIMQGYNVNRQRLRIGKFRVIYRYMTETTVEILHIMNIDSRGDIYKRQKEVIVMSNTAQQVANMIDMLPESDQQLAFELIKKLVLAWDPNFTKVTPQEAKELEEAEINMKNGDIVSHEDIDWD